MSLFHFAGDLVPSLGLERLRALVTEPLDDLMRSVLKACVSVPTHPSPAVTAKSASSKDGFKRDEKNSTATEHIQIISEELISSLGNRCRVNVHLYLC